MSWQPWSASNPGVVPGLTGLSSVVNPAPSVLPAGSQYTPEQWAQMQHQNWQQWAQWQQQYQQWHQQYGAEYQKSMSALSQTATATTPPTQPTTTSRSSFQPPIPNTSVPPPLPKESKPPLPPEEPPTEMPLQTSNKNNDQNYLSGPPPLFNTAPPQIQSQSHYNKQHPQSHNQPPPNIRQNQGGNYNNYTNQNRNKNQTQYKEKFRNSGNTPPKSDYSGEKRPMQQPTFNEPKKTKTENNSNTNPQTPAGNANEDMSETEKKFVKQFTEWEAQFNKWKDQNMNHPDKEQYREYEKKWETWRTQLLERREQMRRKRLGIAEPKPTSESKSYIPPLMKQPIYPSAIPLLGKGIIDTTKPPPLMGTTSSTSSDYIDTKDIFSAAKDSLADTNIMSEKNSQPDDFTHNIMEEEPPDDGTRFLKMSNTSDGIPGLDLVLDNQEDEKKEDAVELDKENNKTEQNNDNKGADLEAISKGINNILGDQKLLNMLSLVSQNQITQPTPSTIDDTTPKIQTNTISQDNFQNVNDGSHKGDRWSNNEEYPRNNENPGNYDEQSRSSFAGRGNDFEGRDKYNNPGGTYSGGYDNQNESQTETNNYDRDFDNAFPGGNLQRPGDFKGPENFRGSDNFRNQDNFGGNEDNYRNRTDGFRGDRRGNNFRGSDNFRGPDNSQGPENFRGSDNFGGPDNFRDSGNFSGGNNFRGPDNFGGSQNNFRGSEQGRNLNFRGPNFNENEKPQSSFEPPTDNFRECDNFGGPDNYRRLDNFRGQQQNFNQKDDFQNTDGFRRSADFSARGPPPNFQNRDFASNRDSENFNAPGNLGGDDDRFGNRGENFRGNDRRAFGRNSFGNDGVPPNNFQAGANRQGSNFKGMEEQSSNNRPYQFSSKEFDHTQNDFNRCSNFQGERKNFMGGQRNFNNDDFENRPDNTRDWQKQDSNNFDRNQEYNASNLAPQEFGNFPSQESNPDNENPEIPTNEIEDNENENEGSLWQPTNIIEYDHKSSKSDDPEVSLDPLRTFDYRHKSVNRIPFPQRPKWLARLLHKFPEFDFVIQRTYDQPYNRYQDRFDKYPEGGRYENKWNNREHPGSRRTTEEPPMNRRTLLDEPPMTRRTLLDEPPMNRRTLLDEPPMNRRTLLDESPMNRRTLLDEPPIIRRRIDDSLGNRRIMDELPGNRRIMDEMPGNRRIMDEMTGNRRIMDEMPGNRRIMDELPGNRRIMDELPGNRRIMDELPGNRRIMDELPDNRRIMDEVPGNRKLMDDISGSRRSIGESFSNKRNMEEQPKNQRRYDNYGPSSNRRYQDEPIYPVENYDKKIEEEEMRDEEYDRYRNKPFLDTKDMNRLETEKVSPVDIISRVNSNITLIQDVLNPPGRYNRPPRIVIILRGPPGSGKTFLAKLIKDKEVENGGSAPRILSLDDYFMVEQEKEVIEDGKKSKVKEMVYEYEECMENTYRVSLFKAFKKTITDGYFPFIIVDNVNEKVKYFGEMWSFAKQNGFQVYICQMEFDVATCTKRNIHGRSEIEIERLTSNWEPTPAHHPILDATILIQSASIPEVEMEEINSPPSEDMDDEDAEDRMSRSKWDNFECSNDNLAKLDGTSRPLRASKTMEDYLQCDDDWVSRESTKPGQKRVRWADLEERKEQEKMRAIGFVVGQTNWDRMLDPTMGSSALTKTKYIERVNKSRFFRE